jgi:hypothetical protein
LPTTFLQMDAFKRIGNTKSVQQPQDGDNNHHGVENSFYFAIHWNKAIDKPKQNTHNNERNYDTDYRHN